MTFTESDFPDEVAPLSYDVVDGDTPALFAPGETVKVASGDADFVELPEPTYWVLTRADGAFVVEGGLLHRQGTSGPTSVDRAGGVFRFGRASDAATCHDPFDDADVFPADVVVDAADGPTRLESGDTAVVHIHDVDARALSRGASRSICTPGVLNEGDVCAQFDTAHVYAYALAAAE